MVPLFLLNYSGGGTRRGTYASGSSSVGGRRRGPRSAGGGQSGHSANSGDSPMADDDEDA